MRNKLLIAALTLSGCASTGEPELDVAAMVRELRAVTEREATALNATYENRAGGRRNECVSAGHEPETADFSMCMVELEKRDQPWAISAAQRFVAEAQDRATAFIVKIGGLSPQFMGQVCSTSGIIPEFGQPYTQCTSTLITISEGIRNRAAQNSAARAAFAASFLARQRQPTVSAPTQCISQPLGRTITTNCY